MLRTVKEIIHHIKEGWKCKFVSLVGWWVRIDVHYVGDLSRVGGKFFLWIEEAVVVGVKTYKFIVIASVSKNGVQK